MKSGSSQVEKIFANTQPTADVALSISRHLLSASVEICCPPPTISYSGKLEWTAQAGLNYIRKSPS